MTSLSQRKSRLQFETSETIRERGQSRPVLVEANEDFATFRLKGTRHRLIVSWAGLYAFAARVEADRNRAAKAAAKKIKKEAR